MNVNSATGDSIEVLLRQIGATQIKKVRGILYFIKFQLIENVEISYVYNINAKNNYFLQRIKPYPIPQGVFTDEYEIVSFIKKDLNKFNKIKNEDMFNSFLELNKKIAYMANNMEHLFLNYTVNEDNFTKLDNLINNMSCIIDDIKESSTKNIDN